MFPPTGGLVSVNRKLEGQPEPDSLGQINESTNFDNFKPSVASSGMAYDYQNINIKDQLLNSTPEKSSSTLPPNNLPLAVKFEQLTASGRKVQATHM